MRDLFAGKVSRLRRRLLALDSAVDAAFYNGRRMLGRVWTYLVEGSNALRVRGVRRAGVELACEGLTWGTAGALAMLALAQPAFEATKGDWRGRANLAVAFLDRTGHEIGRRGIIQSNTVPFSELPDHLLKAAMAIEDRRFYTHLGIDIPGTLRALVENARAHTVVQGGSSITQQLAKNIFLSNERTLERKIREAFLAVWLEFHLSKDEIFKLYLDHAYLGGGTFGVEAAARFYFGKSVRELTLAESAMIAGLFKAPTKYAPHLNLPAARARANVVLDTMVEAGFMTDGQVHAARLNPATPVARARDTSPDYYLDWAFREVKELADAGAFGSQRSLVVKTALDPAIQARAESAIETLLREQGPRYGVHQAALVLQEPFGAVRAMVGGRDYGVSQFNRAADALRQPGSSFKAYVYTAAMENGYTPQSIVLDGPISIGNWSPQNYGHTYAGRVPLILAFTKSLNTVPVRLAQAVGREKIVEVAHRMGVETKLAISRPLPLGVAEMTVLDQAAGYSTLANGGFRTRPYAAIEVSASSGELLWRRDREVPPPERVLSPEVVANMNTMLVNVVEAGTGRRARIEGVQMGGKTGTSQAHRDAWFIGFSGNFVGAVWFGNDDFTATRTMTGGSLPAMAFRETMLVAQAGVTPAPIPGVAPPVAKKGAAPVVAQAEPEPDIARAGRLTKRATGVLNDIERLMSGLSAGVAKPAAPPPERSSDAAQGRTRLSADTSRPPRTLQR